MESTEVPADDAPRLEHIDPEAEDALEKSRARNVSKAAIHLRDAATHEVEGDYYAAIDSYSAGLSKLRAAEQWTLFADVQQRLDELTKRRKLGEAIWWATRRNQTSTLNILLDDPFAGASVDWRFSGVTWSTSLAVMCTKHITPLREACYWGHADAARLLLRQHADPNAQDSHGGSAIWYAAKFAPKHAGCATCLSVILAHGALVPPGMRRRLPADALEKLNAAIYLEGQHASARTPCYALARAISRKTCSRR